jgi:two-component system chemotaxis sensor kinase CheA
MSDDDFLLVIQDDFLQETLDSLGRVEALSLALEKNPGSEKIFSELARLGHNMKGAGKAVGFEHIAKMGHHLEDFILAIKNNIIPATPYHLDFLFKCLDQLKADIALLISDKASRLDHEPILNEIERRLHSSDKIENAAPNIIELDIEKFEALEASSAIDSSIEIKSDITSGIPQAPLKAQGSPSTEAQEVQAVAASSKDLNKTTQTEVLRIQKPKIDYLLDAFGEQVILQTTLEQYKYDLEANKELVLKTISQLTKLTFELQSHALSLTMVQLNPTFTKLERATRDAARMCDKSIQIDLLGGDTEIDKTLIDTLSDSLTHMVRNAVDHAIEDAQERKRKGKNTQGRVGISARRVGGQLWIEISDDGKGLNPEMIKQKAIAKGIIKSAEAEKMSVQDCYHLIFSNGFSTKEAVSELSGRGVGMNVVQESVSLLKGTIEIQSEMDVGTTFRLKVPLSLAIFNGTVVEVGSHRFVVPNSEITEIGKISVENRIKVSSSNAAIQIRNEIYELIDLREKLASVRPIHEFKENDKNDRKSNKKSDLPVLISKKYGNKAFLVDSIVGMQKVVQKPLGDEIKSKPEYAAGTILGDGSPGVILNLHVFANFG